MNIEELNKLEEKVNKMVNGLKLLKDENKRLRLEMEALKNQATESSEERSQVHQKVASLIQLIESIEQE